MFNSLGICYACSCWSGTNGWEYFFICSRWGLFYCGCCMLSHIFLLLFNFIDRAMGMGMGIFENCKTFMNSKFQMIGLHWNVRIEKCEWIMCARQDIKSFEWDEIKCGAAVWREKAHHNLCIARETTWMPKYNTIFCQIFCSVIITKRVCKRREKSKQSLPFADR